MHLPRLLPLLLLLVSSQARRRMNAPKEDRMSAPDNKSLKSQLDEQLASQVQLAQHVASVYFHPAYRTVRQNNKLSLMLLVSLALYLLACLYSCLFSSSKALKTNWNLRAQPQDETDKLNSQIKQLHDDLLALQTHPKSSSSSDQCLQKQLEQ